MEIGNYFRSNSVHILKVIHLHTDTKFLNNVIRFQGDLFENVSVLINGDKSLQNDELIVFNAKECDKIIEICLSADVVVLYDLDILKMKIAKALPESVKVAWRFFGYELYGKLNEEIYTEISLSFVEGGITDQAKDVVKDLLRPFYHTLKYGKTMDEMMSDAFNRIDYMLVLTKPEYDYLVKKWPNLPEFVELSKVVDLFNEKDDCLSLSRDIKSNKVVIGNNRNISNNHLDILEIIEEASDREAYNFQFLFNYGKEWKYTNHIKSFIRGKSYYSLLEEFMSKEEFNRFYIAVSALVMNGFRQMAMANIFHAFKNGVKVYLNKNNIMVEWFLDIGLKVYSIDQLKNDIEQNNLTLDTETMRENCSILKQVLEKDSHIAFQKRFYKKLKAS